MTSAQTTDAERTMQPKFSIRWALAAFFLIAAIAVFDRWEATFADREELGWRLARIDAAPVVLDARDFAPFRLAGAWRLTSNDRRFGGLSALAMDGGRLLALSDSGVVVRFSASRRAAWIGELPDGPGNPGFKFDRDSEALVADPAGRGWWVAFENRGELWLYDRTFARAVRRIALGERGWPVNQGIEGAVRDGESLLLLHESGDNLLRLTGTRARAMPIAGAAARLSEAIDIGGGLLLVVERQLTPLGFRNMLVVLERANGGYRLGRRYRLPLGRHDNVEGAAIERLADGRRRLWLITDDNLQPPLRTLLVALDLPDQSPEKGLAKSSR